MRADAWAYPSGLCAARETAFFPDRVVEEMASLAPDELTGRLARSWFGAPGPLAEFDAACGARRRAEHRELAGVIPAPWPLALATLRERADAVRSRLGALPEEVEGEEEDAGSRMAGWAFESGSPDLERALAAPLRRGSLPLRTAAALAVDAAELAAALEAARASADPLLRDWALLHLRAGCARVLLRLARREGAREAAAVFLDRLPVPVPEADAFRAKPGEEAARRLYPEGAGPGDEEELLLAEASRATAEHASPGRVLLYLLLFRRQERLLRRAVRQARGAVRAGGAA